MTLPNFFETLLVHVYIDLFCGNGGLKITRARFILNFQNQH
jgi:hypothetical protein